MAKPLIIVALFALVSGCSSNADQDLSKQLSSEHDQLVGRYIPEHKECPEMIIDRSSITIGGGRFHYAISQLEDRLGRTIWTRDGVRLLLMGGCTVQVTHSQNNIPVSFKGKSVVIEFPSSNSGTSISYRKQVSF